MEQSFAGLPIEVRKDSFAVLRNIFSRLWQDMFTSEVVLCLTKLASFINRCWLAWLEIYKTVIFKSANGYPSNIVYTWNIPYACKFPFIYITEQCLLLPGWYKTFPEPLPFNTMVLQVDSDRLFTVVCGNFVVLIFGLWPNKESLLWSVSV